MKPVIYTTIFGDYDTLKPQPDIDVDYVCFTDNPNLTSEQWQIRYEPVFQHLHPRMRAKYFKLICPFEGLSLFIDGSIQIVNPNILNTLSSYLKSGFACYVHPSGRKCLSTEVLASLGMEKYKGLPLAQQAKYYFDQGMPKDYGLWACGLILRDGKYTDFGEKWFMENLLWSYQDQISLPYVSWKESFKIDDIRLDQYACFNQPGTELFKILAHERND